MATDHRSDDLELQEALDNLRDAQVEVIQILVNRLHERNLAELRQIRDEPEVMEAVA